MNPSPNSQGMAVAGKLLPRCLSTFALMLTLHLPAMGDGLPFFRNFTADEYHGNTMNYDIAVSSDGTVYAANFEGVMCYDGVEWRMLHTPSITRITVVYCDSHDVIWVGGYDYFGRITTKANGDLTLTNLAPAGLFHGEVEEIWEEGDGIVHFLVSDGNIYEFKNGKASVFERVSEHGMKIGLNDLVDLDALGRGQDIMIKTDERQTLDLGHGLTVKVLKNRGLQFTNNRGKILHTLTEANGLSTDNMSYVEYDDHGLLWCATENGLISMAVHSAYSRYTSNEGLRSAVQCISEYNGTMYVGTVDGLYRLHDDRFTPVAGVGYGCWQLCPTSHGLLVATANGVFCISAGGDLRQLTNVGAMSILDDDGGFYYGALDALYYMTWHGERRMVSKLEKVNRMLRDPQGTLWVQNLYGRVLRSQAGSSELKPVVFDARSSAAAASSSESSMATIVPLSDKVSAVTVDVSTPFPYPLYSYLNTAGITWLTDSEGKQLYRWYDGQRLTDINSLLAPIADVTVRALYQRENLLWIGTDNGIIILNIASKDPLLKKSDARIRFRSVILNGDSILWGGFSAMPQKLPVLANTDRNLRFTYAVDYEPLIGKTLYRYRLNNDNWSTWDDDQDAEFLGLSPGDYTITVQARLANGHFTPEVSTKFKIDKPFYLKWYMNILYLMLLALIVYGLMRYRLIRLQREKRRLETIVQERTAEVVSQKNEIEEKSVSLERALTELHDAQGELIRQEKMATVGKLTQGLIDRILNPLNYINNFSKLSQGLVRDVVANIEDEKEAIDADNYDDTMDILGMLRGNLEKVSDHGQNTTRTLKAMEEMLKDRSGGITSVDLAALLQQDMEMLRTYFAADIAQYNIQTMLDCPSKEILVKANAEQLSKTFMSLLGNSVYAVVKKHQRTAFTPQVRMGVTLADTQVTIVFYDNGIGIEETIIDKVFDPFFTTKTTAEAAGVGLYLSREIIQNYGGDIKVQSEKDNYTEFTITLPLLKS